MAAVGDARKRAAENASALADKWQSAVDARALADLLHGYLGPQCVDVADLDAPPCWSAAQSVLASDWLAAHTAAAREKALRDAADALEDHTDCDCEGREEGDHLRHLAAPSWLRDRAAREAARNAGAS